MDFFEVLDKRVSTRAFLDKEIEGEKLQQILEAAVSAPSAGNLQAFKIIAVKEQGMKKALAEAAIGQGFVAKAPVVLVFFADPEKSSARYGQRGKELYCIQDAAIACCYAQLAAAALGLASVWVGAFDGAKVKKALGVEGSLKPVALLPIGHAGESPFRAKKQGLARLVQFV